MTLHTFSAEASAALPGPEWLRQRRAAGHDAFAATPLPTEGEEVWRYAPIGELALGDFAPAAADGQAGAGAEAGEQLLAAVTATLGSAVAGSVLVHGGRAAAFHVAAGPASSGFSFGPAGEVEGSRAMLGSVQQGGDALVRLNDAFAPDPVFVDVPAGVTVDGPVLVVHWCEPGAAAFPRLACAPARGLP